MERCDVLVVGGGPAGAACAGRLRDLPSGLLASLGALLLGSAFLARRVVLDRWFLGAGLMRYAAARPPEQGAALRSAS